MGMMLVRRKKQAAKNAAKKQPAQVKVAEKPAKSKKKDN